MSQPADQTFAPNESAGSSTAVALAAASALLAGAATAWVATRGGGEAATEGRFLAGVAASVLALLAPAMARSRHAAAPMAWCVALLLAVVAQVAITDGPLRASTLGALLAIAVAAAWLDLLEDTPDEGSRALEAAGSEPTRDLRSKLIALVPLCVATQVLARATVIVEQGPGASAWMRSLLELVGLPAVAALAFAALPVWRRDPADAPGYRFALLAVVAAAGRFHASLVATLLVFVLLPRCVSRERFLAERLLLAAPLVAIVLLRPAAAVVAIAAVTALWLRRSWPAVLLVASGLLLWLEPARSWLDTTTGLWLLIALVPATIATSLARRPAPPSASSRPEPSGEPAAAPPSPLFWLGAALALALVSSRVLEPRAGLVAPVLLLGLAAPVVASRLRFAQAVWLSMLLAFGLASQALPWMRAPGLRDLLVAIGWRTDTAILALAATLVTLFLIVALLLARGRDAAAASITIVLPGALALLLLLPAARGGRTVTTPLEWPPRTLTAAEPTFVGKSESAAWPLELVIDSALAHAGTLPAGTPVARVRLGRAGGGEPLFERALRIGSDTGEWAAGSPELRGAAAPGAHLVAIPERGRFFAKRYRTVVELPRFTPGHDGAGTPLHPRRRHPQRQPRGMPAPEVPVEIPVESPVEITVERDAGLPPAVTLTLFGVRLRGHASEGEVVQP